MSPAYFLPCLLFDSSHSSHIHARPSLSLTMLYTWPSHSSALFILLTSITTHALYIPRSRIITTTATTTTTTTKTTFVWSDQNQPFDPSNEDAPTLPFTCFTCPMNAKLLREIRIFTPTVEIGALSNDPEPRALLCEYDTNESPCRYDPVRRLCVSSSYVSSLTARRPRRPLARFSSTNPPEIPVPNQPVYLLNVGPSTSSPHCGPLPLRWAA